MVKILSINNLNYSYEQRQVISNFNLEVEEGSWVSIVGPNNAGKTTLVKILAGLNKTKADIMVDGIKMDDKNLMKIRSKIGFIFDNPDEMLVGQTVRDDIVFGLENLNIPKAEITRRLQQVVQLLKLEEILDAEPEHLSGGEKQKVALASILAMNVKILVLDDALSMVDCSEKKEITKILKSLHKTTNLTIITIASTLEDVLDADELVIMDQGIKVVEGKTINVLKEEHILINLEMRLPFVVDLSLKLKDYDLLDDVALDMRELVNKLWP